VELSRWVASRIVNEKKLEKRAKFIKNMITLAFELYKLNNFNACSEILLGLTLSPVTRLNQTWTILKKKKKVFMMFEDIQDLFSFNDNFKQYKSTLANSAPPCIPAFSFILMELQNNDNLFQDKVKFEEKEYINVEKIIKLHEMTLILDMLKQPYNLTKVEPIYNFLTSDIIFLGDDILFEKSKEIEKIDEKKETGARNSVLLRNSQKEKTKHRTSILMKEKEKDKIKIKKVKEKKT